MNQNMLLAAAACSKHTFGAMIPPFSEDDL